MVYKRGRTWWYEFEFGGARRRASCKTTNQRAARQIEAAARLALAQGRAGIAPAAPPGTLRALLPRVADYLATTHADRPQTVDWYRRHCRYLAAYAPLASARLDAITSERIAAYAAWRRQRVSVAMTNRSLAVLRRALRLAVEWGEAATAPKVRLLGGEHRREAVLPPEREADYLEALRPELAPIAGLILATGLRPGEALALRWDDLDVGAAELRVRAAVAKSKRERRVPLSSAAAAILGRLPRLGPSLWGAVAPTLRSLQHDHQRVRRLLALDPELTLHSLRHTAATRMGASGMDAWALQAILGHATVTTTQRYVHPQRETLRAAIQRMEPAPQVPTKPPTAARSAIAAGRPKLVVSR